MDRERIKDFLSRILAGESSSRILLSQKQYDELKKYLFGESEANILERIGRDEKSVTTYSKLDTLLNMFKMRYETRWKSIRRKSSLINLLTILILSSINPFILVIAYFRDLIGKTAPLEISYDLSQITNLKRVVDVYGLLQVFLITYLIQKVFNTTNKFHRNMILYTILYMILSNLFTSLLLRTIV